MEKEQANKIVKSLADEINICFHWINEFNILFPEEKLQYDLYNETAPNFFSYLTRFYYDYFFLKISKMLDPAKMGGFENLSLYQLEIIANIFFPAISTKIKNDIDSLKDEAKIILTARKKIIAHKDLDVTINNEFIGETKFSELESIINKISKIINEVLELLGETPYPFVWMRDFKGATALINALKQSRYYCDLSCEVDLFDRIRKIEMNNKFTKL
jgi:hypothetical protein